MVAEGLPLATLPLGLWIGIVAPALSVVIPACIRLWQARNYKPKLTILSAHYGTGAVTDRDVTETVKRFSEGNSLALWIDNNAFGFDPHAGETKLLKVQYSYGNQHVKSIVREEGTYLILPEDEWLKNLYTTSQGQLTLRKANCTHVYNSLNIGMVPSWFDPSINDLAQEIAKPENNLDKYDCTWRTPLRRLATAILYEQEKCGVAEAQLAESGRKLAEAQAQIAEDAAAYESLNETCGKYMADAERAEAEIERLKATPVEKPPELPVP